jgi:hypothetical protein
MRKAWEEQRRTWRDEMKKARDEFRALRDDPKADPNKVDALIDQMSKLSADKMKARLQHRRDFEKILTPQQKDKLSQLRDRRREFWGEGRRFGFMNRYRGFGPGFGRGFRFGYGQGFWRFQGRPGFFQPWGGHHEMRYRLRHWWRNL